MKLSDIVSQVSIDPRKLTAYALDPNHIEGKDKAVVFAKVLGFTQDNYVLLLQQLETKVLSCEAMLHKETGYGILYTVDILVEGVTGRQVIVRTGWLVSKIDKIARLVTLRVKEK